MVCICSVSFDLFFVIFVEFLVISLFCNPSHLADEPKYWWFELLILLNKTMMCGGLVVLAPGSPLQVLAAILIMLLHLLLVLKLAPFVNESEDWSAMLTTLGLCLLSLGAFAMMLHVEGDELQLINIITTVLPVFCILMVLGIVVFVDCGVWHRIQGKMKKNTARTPPPTRVLPLTAGSKTEIVARQEQQQQTSEAQGPSMLHVLSRKNVLSVLDKHKTKEKVLETVKNAEIHRASYVEGVAQRKKESDRKLELRLANRGKKKATVAVVSPSKLSAATGATGAIGATGGSPPHSSIERARQFLRKNGNFDKMVKKMSKHGGTIEKDDGILLNRDRLCQLLGSMKMKEPDMFLTRQFGKENISKQELKVWVFD